MSLASYLRSPTIRLVPTDASNVEYTAHRALLHHALSSLQLPARASYVEIDGDAESIGYLLEYIYTGDYHPASAAAVATPETPIARIPDTKTEQEVVEPHPMVLASRTSGLGVWGKLPAIHTSVQQETPPSKTDNKHNLPTVTHLSSSNRTPSSGATPASASSSAATFIIHAKLYLLAEQYDYPTLQAFALQKLRAALKTAEIEPQENRTQILVSLIRDVYALQGGRGGKKGQQTRQKLRDVVVLQAVNHLEELQRDEEFNAFVREGKSEFVTDLLSSLTASRLVFT